MKNPALKTVVLGVATLAAWEFVARPFLSKLTNRGPQT